MFSRGVGRGSRAPLLPAGRRASARASGGRSCGGTGGLERSRGSPRSLLSALLRKGTSSLNVNLRAGFRPVTARPAELVPL